MCSPSSSPSLELSLSLFLFLFLFFRGEDFFEARILHSPGMEEVIVSAHWLFEVAKQTIMIDASLGDRSAANFLV